MAALTDLIGPAGAVGEGVLVRSDEVDGNDVSGIVLGPTGERRFAASFSDEGEILGCRIEPAP